VADYRDELEAAHRKIAKLESELHAPPPAAVAPGRARSRAGMVASVVVGVLTALLVGGGMLSYCLVRGPVASAPSVAIVPAAVTRLPKTIHVRWTSALGRAPSFVDAEADGLDAMLAIVWNDARRDRPLWVVALDTTTFEPKWRAGPFPGQEGDSAAHLVVVKTTAGPVVLLTESQGGVHAMELATGRRSGDWSVGVAVTGVCTADDGSGRASLSPGFGGKHRTLDLRSGVLDAKETEAQAFPCHGGRSELAFCGDGGVSTTPRVARPCISYAHVRGRSPFDPFTTYEGADTVLTTGLAPRRADAGPLERPAPWGVGADAKTKAVRWEGALSEADRVHLGGDRADFDGDHFVIGYQLVSGPFRIVARNATSGAVTWSALLDGSHEGSVLSALRIHHGLVVADIDGRLDVFALEGGSKRASVSALEIASPEPEPR
jgi:hypothetical protein